MTAADPAADLAVRARRVFTGEGVVPATVAVRAGRIVAVEPYDSDLRAASRVELADDEVLLPGVVDTHVHVNEPGRTEWEGFDTATRAAAAGGVTTLLDMPLNSIPPTVGQHALEVKRAAATDQCHVDVGFWGGAVPANVGTLTPLHDAGVFGFKCFLLPSGVEEFPPLDAAGLSEALREIHTVDSLLIVHAEDCGVVAHAPPARGPVYADFVRSRPRRAENLAIAAVIDQARRIGARVHVLHLSSADALPMIASARADGVALTVETCPHYLTFSAEEIPDGATLFKCCPPIREAANRELLWAGLGDGAIDCIVSDHSPCTPDLKRLDSGDFGEAWGGIASLQLGLPVVWTEASRRGYTLGDVVRWMCTRPAEIAGLSRKGRLAIGRDADLVAFAPDEEFVVDVAALHHRNPVTPYVGRALRGLVRGTWLRGVPVDGRAPRGRLLTRGGA